MRFPTLTIATAIVFLLTYAGIALGRIPGFRLDRAGIALTGAALMMAIGAITPDEAYRGQPRPVAMAAFLGGALLLVARAIKAHKVYQEIDGSVERHTGSGNAGCRSC